MTEKSQNRSEEAARKKREEVALRPYVVSLLSLFLLISMFAGTTLAWLTAEVSSSSAILITFVLSMFVLPFSRSRYAVSEMSSLLAISSWVSLLAFLFLRMLSLMVKLSLVSYVDMDKII